MKGLVLFLISFISQRTWASIDSISLYPVLTDVSINYLSNAFGAIDGLLQGGGSQILGRMFSVMNTVLLCCAGILWSYTSCIGILNTASEGQFLGQKWSSMWVPVRIVGGTCLLIPKATTGYSMIQVIIMYVVIQGIGLANHVWSTAINYLDNFGTVVESNILHRHALEEDVTDHSFLIRQVGDILKAEVSMIVLKHALESQQENKIRLNTYFTPALYVQPTQNGKVIQFPSTHISFKEKNITGICGHISWKNTSEPVFDEVIAAGIYLMASQLLPLAQQIAQAVITTADSKTSHSSVYDTFLPNGILLNSAASFVTILKPALLRKNYQNSEKFDKDFRHNQQKIKSEGWIMAGSYYYQLAKYNQKIRFLSQNIDSFHHYMQTEFSALEIEQRLKDFKIKEQLNKVIQEIDNAVRREQIKDGHAYYTKLFPQGEEGHPFTEFDEKDRKVMRNDFFSPFHKNIRLFQRHMEATMQSHVDPIVALASIGSMLIYAVEESWRGVVQDFITLSGVFFKATSQADQNWRSNVTLDKNSFVGKLGMLFAFTPLVVIWTITNFVIGATLLYYIPLVPFLIFFSGSMTWFLFVFEAMIAGVLIALGLMHPEGGHDFFGKAEQATMLLASLFFRPVFMIFGFFGSIILCNVVFNFFHYSYNIATQSVHQLEWNSDWLNIITHTAMLTVYTTIAIAIVNRSFSMIYEIPNRALRWMSGPTDGHNETDVPMQVKSGVERYTGDAGGRVTSPMAPPPSQPQERSTSGRGTVRVDMPS